MQRLGHEVQNIADVGGVNLRYEIRVVPAIRQTAAMEENRLPAFGMAGNFSIPMDISIDRVKILVMIFCSEFLHLAKMKESPNRMLLPQAVEAPVLLDSMHIQAFADLSHVGTRISQENYRNAQEVRKCSPITSLGLCLKEIY